MGLRGPVMGLRRDLRRLRELVFPAVCPVCRAACSEEMGEPCAACGEGLPELPAPRCPGCGGSRDGVLDLCGECLQTGPRSWDHAVSVFDFEGDIRDIIHRFKYQGQASLAPFLARRMRRNWEGFGKGLPLAIVPVPLHWGKELVRGYNQAELLADGLGRGLGIPVRRLLRRGHWTRQQAKLTFADRQRNVRGVFQVRDRNRVTGADLLLVDDVMTTGATLGEAAAVLKKAGAARVSVITAARG